MATAATESSRIVQTTVRLPEPLYREVKQLLEQGQLESTSLNELVIEALTRLVHEAREKSIDEQFSGMATDTKYAEQCRVVAGEFARADWEALQEDGKSRAAR